MTTTPKPTKPEKPKAERKKRAPKELNEYELAGRAVKVIAEFDARAKRHAAALYATNAEKRKYVETLGADVLALLKIDSFGNKVDAAT